MYQQPLSFGADRRTVQTTFYHFNDRIPGDSDKYGFSQQESLNYALGKIYENKFPDISPQFRSTLVDILTKYVPLPHHNLSMLAAAQYVIYYMRTYGHNLDVNPEHYAAPVCDSPPQPCISGTPNIVSCKQNTVSVLDPTNRNIFEQYFNYVAPFIMSDVTEQNAVEKRALYKITMLRYIIFIQNCLANATNSTQTI
jgi:hypothetical protein